jgi:hypothetical protein
MTLQEIEQLAEWRCPEDDIDMSASPHEIAAARKHNRTVMARRARLVKWYQSHPEEFAKDWKVYNDGEE